MVGTEWTDGAVDGALNFDGFDDYVAIQNLYYDGSGYAEVSVTAWIRTTDGNDQIIASYDRNEYWRLEINGSGGGPGQVGWDVRTSTGQVDYGSTTRVDDGEWHHVAAVFDNGTLTIYIDGNPEPSASGGSTFGRGVNTRYGFLGVGSEATTFDGSRGPNNYFNGDMDDVRIYDRALSAEEIAELAETLRYEEFTEAKADSDTTSIAVPTPGGSSAVAILGSWTSGLTHTAEAGSNRLLILTAHVEDDDADMSLNSVTYGGQPMTKVIERETQESSRRAYVVAYVLNEAGISAATGDTFSPSWSSDPDRVGYSSVFLASVDQSDPVGASDSDGSNSDSTISTGALSTDEGDMVIVAGTAGNTGSYSVGGGFTEAIELSITSADGVAGYKTADGSSETPSITHSNPQRQVIIGFVVQINEGGIEGIEGDLLIAAVATDGSTTISPPSGWTEISQGSYGSAVTLGAWWKLASASESSSYQFTWSGGQQAYGWMMRFTGHNPTNPINAWSVGSGGETGSTPTSPAVNATVGGCLVLRLGAFDNDDITEDDPGLSGHTAITMDKSSSSAITLFQDDFEDDFSQWTDGGTTDWDITASEYHSGSYSAHAGSSDDDLISDDIDTSAYSSFTIDFWYMDDDIDDDDNIYLQLYDGGSYDDRFELGNEWPEDTWRNYNETINNSGADAQYFRSDFRIKFEATSLDSGGGPGGSENLWIDDVMVTTTSDGVVSGGAGYIVQSSAGSSGTSTFTLTASQEARMLTIAIAPADSSVGCCGEEIRP